MKKKVALLLAIVMMFSSFSCACNSQERGRRDRHKDEKSDEKKDNTILYIDGIKQNNQNSISIKNSSSRFCSISKTAI